MSRYATTLITLLLLSLPSLALSDPPELESWMLNTAGVTGFNGLPANVQRVRYSATNAYVNCSGIPDYTIGPWPMNPNTVGNRNFLFQIPRAPVANGGTLTAAPLGPIGVWVNGVVVYNALDARSYNNQNIWHQNAVVVEAGGFDACYGHPSPDSTYHHHQNPHCLYTSNPAAHSRLLGFAFDGYPIYGPYAYANSDGSGGIARMRSSYRLRAITTRTTLPNGTVLSPPQYGPAVSSTYPLGYYVEDFEYVGGLGELDAQNGRTTVTPEYPGGTYAYFVTIDGSGASEYPYAIGPNYHGVVATANITSHGRVTIGEAVSEYTPPWLGLDPTVTSDAVRLGAIAPNPCSGGSAALTFALAHESDARVALLDLAGRQVCTVLDGRRAAGAQRVNLDVAGLQPGVYFVQLRAAGVSRARALWIVR